MIILDRAAGFDADGNDDPTNLGIFLQFFLGGVPAAQLPFVTAFVEFDDANQEADPTSFNGVSNSTTEVVILEPPSNVGLTRQLKSFNTTNPNAANTDVTLHFTDNTTDRILIGPVTLEQYDTLHYIDTRGFFVTDKFGNIKTAVTSADAGGGIGSQKATLNGTTNVTILSAPASGHKRKVLAIRATNLDTAVVTLNLYKNISATVTLVDTIVGLAVSGVWKPVNTIEPMILNDSTESLEIDMGGAAATVNPVVYTEFEDIVP